MDVGIVVEWVVAEDDVVEEGDVVVVIESEKASSEVEAREDGVLRQALVEEGDEVAPGTPIGIIAGRDEDLSSFDDLLDGDSRSPADSERTEPLPSDSPQVVESSEASTTTSSKRTSVQATPGARKLASENDIDLASINGSGPQGVITDEDVEEYRSMNAGTSAGASHTVVERRTLSGIQATVSDRLSQSYRDATHVTLNRSFETDSLRAVAGAAKRRGESVSLTDLMIKAVGDALREHPAFNALFEDGEHKLISEVNVNVAVDVEDGLVTPVIPRVTEKSAEEVHAVRGNLTERVRAGEFVADDLSGGTFTVSNLGLFGVDDFDPIINPPQIAILGVGRISDDGSMTLCLSFDHRVVNGADAAWFLETLTKALTDAPILASYLNADVSIDDVPLEREVRVATGSGYAGTYRTASGTITFDEPKAIGGDGSAPSPVDHLLGALGSCLSLSVQEMANRSDLVVDSIECHVVGSPDTGALQAVDAELELETAADSETVETVITKAERACYIARALSEDLSVSVSWQRA